MITFRIDPFLMRTPLAIAAAVIVSACAAKVPPAPPKPPEPPLEEKASWILRLEDQRALRDPAPDPPPPPPPAPVRGQKPAVVPAEAPPPPPDLVRLLGDAQARIRRRAALAIGRVGLVEGVAPLTKVLGDTDPEVRQMAAFALGLIGDSSAKDPLVAALRDPSPLVQGSAAEALGLIGDRTAADAVGQMAAAILQSGAAAQAPGPEGDGVRDTPVGALRLAIFALVRLNAYDQLAAAVLDGAQPRVRWWPVAFALQRLEDPRAQPALLTLAKDPNPYTRAFAVKGLGAIKDRSAVPILTPLVDGPDRAVAVEAIRALGRIGDPAGAAPLLKLIAAVKADPTLRLEAVTSIGGIKGDGVIDLLLDIVGDPSPPVRAAAIRSLAQLDPENFITVLSGLDPDPHWSVRSALATVLGTLPPETGLPRLETMRDDADERVIPAVVTSLAALKAPGVVDVIGARLKTGDPIVRAAAATALGRLKPASGPVLLAEAYKTGLKDTTYVARGAALAALVEYGAAAATPTLTEALSDNEWAIRVRAAALLKQLDASSDASLRIRPAPTGRPESAYEASRLLAPPVSTHVFIDTDRGTIQVELAVVDAPLSVETFITLARKGFYDGLTFHRVVPDFVIQGGDPRGDGEGGPGFTIRDELGQHPYLRGSVGLALDWEDTGGSQFFITHSPQPHLDGRYTVIGRVISGMEVVDRIQPWDVMRRVRVWDGVQQQ
jgi:HEAT repeat protein/cyclophilin family peptidyl-prolyl cis-trans isomerase